MDHESSESEEEIKQIPIKRQKKHDIESESDQSGEEESKSMLDDSVSESELQDDSEEERMQENLAQSDNEASDLEMHESEDASASNWAKNISVNQHFVFNEN